MARNKVKLRYERFCREYVIDQNGTRAAIAAGYSEQTAYSQASDLLKKPEVRRRIDELLSVRLRKADVTADMVIDGLRALATFDPRRLYREDGTLKHPGELDEETAKAIAGFEVHELFKDGDGAGPIGEVKKYKLLDRGQNLERLGRTMALFTDKVKHEGLDGLADAIAKGRKRIAETDVSRDS
jgi:phage terminase small subunit